MDVVMSRVTLESPTMTNLMRRAEMKSSNMTCPCKLATLPAEMFDRILCLLPLSAVGNLCLTGSSPLRMRVLLWISSQQGCNRVCSFLDPQAVLAEEKLDCWLPTFRSFGLLCKKASMVEGTGTRLRLLSDWHHKLDLQVRVELTRLPLAASTEVANLLSKIGFAVALGAFTRGWDDAENSIVLGSLHQRAEKLCGDSIRLLRLYFWDFLDTDHQKAGWLAYLLRRGTQPVTLLLAARQEVEAARMLYTLFGPAEQVGEEGHLAGLRSKLLGRPDWATLTNTLPGDYYEAQSRFQDLGKAFTVLLKNSDLHAILPAILDSLLNDLDWMLDNQAACLLFTCSEMVNFYFSFLFIKDESRRIAGLLAAMVSVCGKVGNKLEQGLDKVLDWTLTRGKPSTKERLISLFWIEISARLENGDIQENLLVQLGVFSMLAMVKKSTSNKGEINFEE